jgi:hypothetical protein
VLKHLPLVTTIAVGFKTNARSKGVDWDDVLSEGALGLIHAAELWNPDRGPFRFYCRRAIRSAIRSALKLTLPASTGHDLSAVADHRIGRVPSLEPLFPVTSYVPDSECPHRGPLRNTVFVCGVCWCCAYDKHPDLQLTGKDPHPGKRRRHAATIPIPSLTETRRQRRARKFGTAS